MSNPLDRLSAATTKLSKSQINSAWPMAVGCLLAFLSMGFSSAAGGQQAMPGHTANTAAVSRVKHATTPLSFVRNAGQDPTGAQYLAHGPGYAMRLSAGEVELSLLRSAKAPDRNTAPAELGKTEAARLGMVFVGANLKATLEATDPLPGTESYFIGSDQKDWHTGLPTFAKLRYREIYPGIDLTFHGNQAGEDRRRSGEAEYDIELAPHADSSRIAIELNHADHAAIDKDGDLQLSVDGSALRFLKPVAWQGKDRKPVEVSYRLQAAKDGAPAVLSFETGKYDPNQPLVIDPVLDYATYLNLYSETAMTVDSSGNVYVTGQDTNNSSYAFDILKFSPSGTLLYTSVIKPANQSSAGYGYPAAIAVDASGEAYVAGLAGTGWPTSSTAYQAQGGYSGEPYYYNAYLVKLNAAGSAIAYASYLGGNNAPSVYTDYAVALALDGSGNAYMTGIAHSLNFPTTTGAFQTAFPANAGSSTAFVAKFNPAMSGAKSLVYSTLLGDQNAFEYSIAVDSSGAAYLAGYSSNSSNSILAATPGAVTYTGEQSSEGTGAYVTKLNPAGSALVYSAYLGYAGSGNAMAVAVDGSGDAYATGPVNYEDFPTTPGAYQTSYPGGFAVELNPTGSAEIYSTFLSGPSGAINNGYTFPQTIAITPGCSSTCPVYIAGTTYYETDFPQINSVQTVPSTPSSYYGFLVNLNGTGSAATLSTYIGGIASNTNYPTSPYYASLEQSPSVAVDTSGNIYYSADISNPDFPVTTSTASEPGYYPYLAKIGPAAAAQIVVYPNTFNMGNSVVGTSSLVYNSSNLGSVTLRNMGSAPATIGSITGSSSIYSQTNTCAGTIPAGGQCTLTPAFTPTATGTVSGTLSIASNSVTSPLTISLTGNGINDGYLQGSNTTLNFGNQTVGTASGYQTVTIKNTGNQAVTNFSLIDLPAGVNSLNNCPASLAVGQSCEYGFQFAPYQTGLLNADLVYINSSAQDYIYVYISGTGVVSGDAGALTLSATALNFNTLADGTTSANQFVTLTNSGTVPVTVTAYTTALTSSSGSAADFTVHPYTCGAPPFVFQPQSSCSLYETFTPSATAIETASLSIANSTGTTPKVALSGTGVADSQTLVFTPANFVFPDQVVGTTGSNYAFYAANTGAYPVTIDRVYATGDFELKSQACAGGVINPPVKPGDLGGYCYAYVAFVPSATGNRTGTIVFVDTAGGTQTLSLNGNGIAPVGSLVVNPTSLVFPSQAVGTTSPTKSVTFTVNGNSPVTINSYAITGDYAVTTVYNNVCGATLPCTLPAGYYFQATIAFTPTSTTNPRTGTLTVNSSAGVQSVPLSGTGDTASVALALTPAVGSTLNFGSVTSGTSGAYVNVYLRNVGTEALSIPTQPTVTGNYTVYPYSTNSCGYYITTLQPGTSCVVGVLFSPNTTGVQTGVLTFSDTAGTQTLTQTLNLTGTGTAAAPTTYFYPSTLTFPQTAVGSTSTTPYNPSVGTNQYFYYTGTSSLTIASASVTAGGSSFNIPLFGDNCTNTTISSGSQCNIQVNFAPTAAGYQTGTITLTDTNAVKYTLPLFGYSPADVDTGYFSPDSLVFTSQTVGTVSAIQTIYLYDSGNTNMTVGTVGGTNTGEGSEFVLQYDGCSNSAITEGTTSNYCQLNVEFSPSSSGARTGQISVPVTYADGTTGTFTANLTGTGGPITNKAVLTPTSSQYPDTTIGANLGGSYYQSYTLYNVGSLSFTVGQLTGINTIIGNTTVGDYTTSDGCSARTVAAGSNCSVSVYFYPIAGATGARTGSISFPVIYNGATTVTSFTASYTGNAVAASKSLVVTPGAAQLGSWIVGTTSAYTTVTLTNTGNAQLSLGTPTIATPFGLQNNCATTLAAGSTCSIYVEFRPSATGAVTGTLNIPNSAGTTQTVAITGTGIAASQQLAWSQGTVAFGNQLVGTTSNQVTLNLVNQSAATVVVKNVTLAGTNPTDFVLVSNGCLNATLYSGSLCSVVLEFSPASSATGALSATVTESDNGTGGPRTASLTGTGTAAAPSVGLFPSSLVYATQNIGTTSAGQTFSVTNTGSASLKITSVASTGSAEFGISSNACNGLTLAAGADCLVSVVYTPTASGTHSGTISVTDNATGSPQTLPLTGLVPKAALSATSLTFAGQPVGSPSAAQTVTLSNAGTGALNIASIAVGGTDPSDFTSTNTCGTSLGAGGSCSISVIFAPKAAGSLTGTVTVTDDAALAAGSTQSFTLSGTGIPLAATPTFTPAAGTYASAQSVTIADTTSGATIYYTTNGTTPTTSSTKYTGAITVSADETIEAIAVATGYAQSPTASVTYAIDAATPTFTPAAGTYPSAQSVTIADTTSGATIYYTTNGTTPTTSSTKYSGAITVSADETIEAIAVATGYAQSPTASVTYAIDAATPTFTPAAGTYPSAQSVTLADTTTGATIYYTTNGTTPTTASTKYTGAITVSADETIEAIAVATGYAQSATASAAYTIVAATPVFTPAAGTYTATQSVKIADATSGATIYYTTNGTTPTTASTKYTGAISVSATETIEAIAVATGYAQSATATAKYTITPPAATPSFTPVAGTYTASQSVTIADATSGSTIYYTTNGTTPTTASTKYTGAITVSATQTIEAIAVATGYAQSAIATAKYTIMPANARQMY